MWKDTNIICVIYKVTSTFHHRKVELIKVYLDFHAQFVANCNFTQFVDSLRRSVTQLPEDNHSLIAFYMVTNLILNTPWQQTSQVPVSNSMFFLLEALEKVKVSGLAKPYFPSKCLEGLTTKTCIYIMSFTLGGVQRHSVMLTRWKKGSDLRQCQWRNSSGVIWRWGREDRLTVGVPEGKLNC